jgi:hypothetical protein
MTLATPITPNNCFRPAALPNNEAAECASSPPWFRRSVTSRSAAAISGAAVLGSAAGIEVARAWTDAPHPAVEAEQVVGGIVVALFVTAAFGLLMRASVFGSVVVASVFALVAHGSTLALEGEMIGTLFLGLAPIVALLGHLTFATDEELEITAARDALMRTKLLALWMKTSRRRTVRAAPLAASPIPLAMRASQATIIDAWVKKPSASSSGSATPRSCVSNAWAMAAARRE